MHRETPSWAEFRDLIEGLLSTTKSRLWAALDPKDDEPAGV